MQTSVLRCRCLLSVSVFRSTSRLAILSVLVVMPYGQLEYALHLSYYVKGRLLDVQSSKCSS